MPPKGKKGAGGKGKKGGKGGKGGTGGIVDGGELTEMTREQLEQHVTRLRQEMEREREERNFFQLERDKLRTFWEITRQQLEETRAELRNKDREMEEKVEEHQGKANIFKQKVKHLLYEHQNSVAELRAQNMVSLKITEEEFASQEKSLLEDKKVLKDKIVEQDRQREEELKAVRMELSQNLNAARADLEAKAEEVEQRYTNRVTDLREQMQLEHATEMAEVEERKNKHIADLVRSHDAAFLDMKNYYNDVTLNNLALIASLKEQMEEMKRREERMEKALKEVQKENLSLREPLKKAKEEACELSRQLTNYQKDKQSLATTKQCLNAVKKQLEDLQWEREALEQKYAAVTLERDKLRNSFNGALQEVQRKVGLGRALLERKVDMLTETLEEREEQCAQLMASAQSQPEKISQLIGNVEVAQAHKNATIQKLEMQIMKIAKSYNDLLDAALEKLAEYGVTKEQFSFEPFRINIVHD